MKDEALRRERVLVEAARAELPPAGARDRVLVALGVSAAASAAAATATASAGSTVLATKAAGSALLLKSLALGAALGVVGMAATSLWPTSEPSEQRRGAPPPSSAAPALAAQPLGGSLEPSISAASPAASAPAKTHPSLAAPPETPSASPSAGTQPLRAEQVAAERALLDSARQALAGSRASTAIKALADYDQRFGFGILGHEAVVLKMKALLQLGRRADANAIGERYLREQPSGTQAATVRRLLSPQAAPTPATAPSDQNSPSRP